jgi:hypothetical protein
MSWIAKINARSQVEKEGVYRLLIPPTVFTRYGVNPLDFHDYDGTRCCRFYCPPGDPTTLIEVKRRPEDKDCVYSFQLSDTTDRLKLNWDFLILNDIDAERFDTDVDAEGRDTLFGSATRNLDQERRAMEAGLFPGQVRRGPRLLSEFLGGLIHFCRQFDVRTIGLEALYYHNAIAYERRGFAYFAGYKRMKRIDELFQEGGALQRLMDGSTPFRRPGGEKTVHGRAWAIHDGVLDGIDDPVLDEPWTSPEMYLLIGKPRDLHTFDGPWI